MNFVTSSSLSHVFYSNVVRTDSLSSHETPSRNVNKISLPYAESEYLEDEGAAKYKKQNCQIAKDLSDIIIYIQVSIIASILFSLKFEVLGNFSFLNVSARLLENLLPADLKGTKYSETLLFTCVKN